MNELESYLRATEEVCPGGASFSMGEPTTWCSMRHAPDGMPSEMEEDDVIDRLLMHPTKEDVVVGRFVWVNTHFEFTPRFVKECFEASTDGVNPLLDFLYNHIPTE